MGDDALAVSTSTRERGIPVAVLLKALPRTPGSAVRRGGPVVGAVARYHRTPLVIHWGANPWFDLRGVRLPRRFQPSPLELVLHPLVLRPRHNRARALSGLLRSTRRRMPT